MPATTAFSPRILGETEKALNAILRRELAGTQLTEPGWVALSLTMASGEVVAADELLGRIQGGLKVTPAEAEARVDELEAARVVRHEDGVVAITDHGRKVFAQVRGEVVRITGRMWGDLPAADLDTTGRVLGEILARANDELAAA
jgi:DNA-binding MarR family transcriptional regulator